MKLCVLWLAGLGYVRAPLGAANLYAKRNATTQAVEGNLGGFCVVPDLRIETRRGRAPRPFVSELPAGGGLGLASGFLALKL